MIEITEDQFIAALNRVAASDDGQVILACFKEFCRFDGDILAQDSQENTYANAMLRRAYLYFRNRIKPEHLKEIEFNYRRKAHARATDDIHGARGISGQGVGGKNKVK